MASGRGRHIGVRRGPLPLEIPHEPPTGRGRHAPQLPRGQSERKESRSAPPPPGAAAESLWVAPPPRLHKQPCNDVSLRRLQIPPPSASTTAGGGERGRGERARARHGRRRRPSSGLVACWELRRVRSVLTLGHGRPNGDGAHTLPCLAPPVASSKFGLTGREWCIRSLRFRGGEVG